MAFITARQYGAQMRKQNLLWPAPVIGESDRLRPEYIVHRIGDRDTNNAFVLVRMGWGTVYVRPDFTGYREAFDDVMPNTSCRHDVDHLYPKSKVPPGDFVALGRIGKSSNRSWKDDDSHEAMAQKARNMPVRNQHVFLSTLKDIERGWAAVTCYMRPIFEMNMTAMQPIAKTGT